MIDTFYIPEKLVQKAASEGQAIEDYAKSNGLVSKYGVNRGDKDKIGLIGMFALDAMLSEGGISHTMPEMVGRTDRFDFIICGKKIEIKTGQVKSNFDFCVRYPSPNFEFLVEKEQYSKNHAGVYGYGSVLVDLEFTKAVFMGWVEAEAVKTYPVKPKIIACYCIPFSKLKGVELL